MTTRIETGFATLDDGGFSGSAALARRSGFRFGHVASTGSTNDDLAAEARSGDATQAILVTDHQTAGRGRLRRSWLDREGLDLLVSFRLVVHGTPHETVAAVAAALRWAAAELIVEPVGFKWPNDLVVEQGACTGKLAGILAEYVDGGPAVVVVGCGVNVGQVQDPDLAASGLAAAPGATSMAAVGFRDAVGLRGAETASRSEKAIGTLGLGGAATRGAAAVGDEPAGTLFGSAVRDNLLAATIRGLIERLDDPRAAAAELREHSSTLGRRVRAELGEDRALVGRAVDIDPQGRLVVEHAGGRSTVGLGDVVHLRSDA